MNVFRCDYCGRFVSYNDLLYGQAKCGTELYDNGTSSPGENYWCHHVNCAEAETKRLWAKAEGDSQE